MDDREENEPSEPTPARRTPQTIDDITRPSGRRGLKRFPTLVLLAVRLVWEAAPREFAWSALLQIIGGAAIAIQLLLAKTVIEGVVDADAVQAVSSLTPQLIGLAALTALVAFSAAARTEQQRVLGEVVSAYTTKKVIGKALEVDLVEYERADFHDRLQRATINATTRPLQMATGVLGLLNAGFAIVGIVVALVILEPLLAVVVLVAGIPSTIANRQASKLNYAFAVRRTQPDRRRSWLYLVLTRKEEAKELRAFEAGPTFADWHDDLYADRIADLRRVTRRRLRITLLGATISSVLGVGAIGLLLVFVTTGRMELGAAGVAVAAITLLVGRVRSLAGAAGSLYEGSLFLEDFTRFVGETTPATDLATDEQPVFSAREAITLDDVGFTYPSRDHPSLTGVSLTIQPGQVVALVGHNGSGKTTLAKVLAGLYEPTYGTVYWGETRITGDRRHAVRDSVAIIFQDFVRYFLTAAENIAVGRPSRLHDREAVEHAARKAGAHAYLADLPRGFDSALGPEFIGGHDLSVGQWQRVALARAFFRDAPVLILDEPTAALDPRAEHELFESVSELYADRTVILISHRLSSVRAADRIFVLDGGRLIEEGTHPELLAADGHYAGLFRLQAAGYVG